MADQLTIELDFRGQRYQSAELGLKAFAARTGKTLDVAVPVLAQTLRWYLDNVAKAMASRHGGAWPGGTGTNTLSMRSGNLISAIKKSVHVDGDTLESLRGNIGTPGIVYGRIQEFGGTIVPKNTKYLAIPLPDALDGNGLPLKASPRMWDHTFVAKSKAGNLLIFQRQGKNIVPLYVLKSKVYIPPRLGLGDTLRTGMGLFVDRAMTDMLKAIKSAP